MVKQIFVGQLLCVSHRTDMRHLKAPSFLDERVCLSLEFHHRRQVSRNGVRRPYLRMDDPVQRPAKMLNGEQACKAVLSVAQG